jgi:hypothetical protein
MCRKLERMGEKSVWHIFRHCAYLLEQLKITMKISRDSETLPMVFELNASQTRYRYGKMFGVHIFKMQITEFYRFVLTT